MLPVRLSARSGSHAIADVTWGTVILWGREAAARVWRALIEIADAYRGLAFLGPLFCGPAAIVINSRQARTATLARASSGIVWESLSRSSFTALGDRGIARHAGWRRVRNRSGAEYGENRRCNDLLPPSYHVGTGRIETTTSHLRAAAQRCAVDQCERLSTVRPPTSGCS
jgi:hypothetical protein